VSFDGTCDSFTSDPVTVSILSAPAAPGSADVSIPVNTSTTLNATGDNITWYDAASGGNVLGTGNTYNTPVLSTTTSYWCDATEQHGGEQSNGGKTDRAAAAGAYHNNNSFYLLFEAYDDFVLRSVKVYANGAANRTIALIDQSNGSTIASTTVNVPDGESRVQLDFNVTAGGPYGLRVTSSNPQLWRDGQGSNPTFPYALGTLGSITTTSVSGSTANSYYYFFFDWEVEASSVFCAGPRTEVVVHVGSTGIADNAASALTVYPNPADDRLNIAFGDLTGSMDVQLLDITGRVVISRHLNNANGVESLDLTGIAAGEYGLRIRSNAGIDVRRVVVR
ncbi:MAG TPA: T9SS type A sorting domain-containing protein, partial [Flavobacteriales bacterium]|nr:T9SS type A sorting domain-containing protein [Flavobacteriales bacterium]